MLIKNGYNWRIQLEDRQQSPLSVLRENDHDSDHMKYTALLTDSKNSPQTIAEESIFALV